MPSDYKFKVGDIVRRKKRCVTGQWSYGNMLCKIRSLSPSGLEFKLNNCGHAWWVATSFELVTESQEKDYGPGPHLAADAVVICRYHILLVTRKDGKFALPGGFVNPGESTNQTAIRECKEETGLDIRKYVSNIDTEGLGRGYVFDSPKRDPRGHIVTIAHHFPFEEYWNEFPLPKVKGADDVTAANWYRLNELHMYRENFFVDHYEIIGRVLYDV